MHPLIARFLDPSKLVATLEKSAQAVALDPDEAAIAAEFASEPKLKDEVLKAKGRAQPSSQVQQKAIVLSVRAATARVLEHVSLGPKARAAMTALSAEGASDEEARSLVAQVLLEEAFGYAEDPAEFDSAYVAESLESLVPLAKINADLVDGWLETWAKRGPAGDKALRVTVGEALLDAAWSDGPGPIGPEHLDDALDHLGETTASSERAKMLEAMTGFIAFLAEQQIIGTERARRLTGLVAAAARGPSDSEEAAAVDEAEEADDLG